MVTHLYHCDAESGWLNFGHVRRTSTLLALDVRSDGHLR
jgi:hypothetical protein